jgi:nitroimidazol reductase NimA-like FMN-containing flavoprotein (pyridoxamine 5'-phosphate oxidase superfamily)
MYYNSIPATTYRSERTRVRRQLTRGAYDPHAVHAMLDGALVAHVAFVDAGQPYCIPMLHARVDDGVYIHGSSASRALRVLSTGVPACVTVTVLDGVVLARSAFEHSANYRSAVILGRFERVEEAKKRLAALEAFTNKLLPGRWSEVRGPTRKELRATAILRMPIEEASVKARAGPPSDDGSADAELTTWAGVIPILTSYGRPERSPGLKAGIPLPQSALQLLGAGSPSRSAEEVDEST